MKVEVPDEYIPRPMATGISTGEMIARSTMGAVDAYLLAQAIAEERKSDLVEVLADIFRGIKMYQHV